MATRKLKKRRVTKKRGAISLHSRILGDIEGRILSGEWPPGHRIPFEHELIKQYKCSRMTVSKVLTHLVSVKLIERRRKAGSFVTYPHSSSAVLEIADIKAEVAELGLPYHFDIHTRRRRQVSAGDQKHLDVPKGSSILDIVVRHYANDRPFCFEERLINLAAVPEAADEKFEELSPGAWLMSRVPWSDAEHKIRAVAASAVAAENLKIAVDNPCLVVERRTWSSEGAVTFVRLTYPAGEHELVAHFSPSTSTYAQQPQRQASASVINLREHTKLLARKA